MSQEPATYHLPVMVAEIQRILGAVPRGLAIDATAGGGGHSAALLAADPDLQLVALDRDAEAVAAAGARLAPFGARAAVHRARFDDLAQFATATATATAIATAIATATESATATATESARATESPTTPVTTPVTAILFDLGVSSHQLDTPARGFSYRHPGPLDMRMDASQGITADDVVNTYPEAALAALFRANGEGRFAQRIARTIVAARPVHDTATLAELVREGIPAPARRRGGHPAKRVFQALRVEVNDELDVLRNALASALDLLAPGGRLAVISYHSGEDRIVKAAFTDAATGGCTCPPGLPCVCGAVATHRLVFRGGHTPSAGELAHNPRAESARLRAIEALP